MGQHSETGANTRSDRAHVEVYIEAHDLRRALEDDARIGLTSVPKDLPPKYFYDERGCRLFEQITTLTEYYPTRAEREILTVRAHEIAETVAPDTIVELGAGTSEKTRLLLDAATQCGALERFVPFDVSESTLRDSADAIAAGYPTLEVHAVVGDFDHHLDRIPSGGTRLIVFLGGTIGNFAPVERARFLAALSNQMVTGDALLLGIDLVKSTGRLLPAYDDRDGVTAEFNRNVLHVLNRELGADFAPDRFDHVVHWDPHEEWIEMRLRATAYEVVKIPDLDLIVEFTAGEEMRTEISAKFRPAGVERELTTAGLTPRRWWTDTTGEFALTLAMR